MRNYIAAFVLVIAIGILFIACGSKTTDPILSKPAMQQEVYGVDIMRFMQNTNGIDARNYILADSKYTLVDEAWFKANVMNGFNNFLWRNGIAYVDKKKNDCDDFARGFSFFSRVKSMQLKSIDSSLAVADLYYRTIGDGHAINAAVVLNNFGEWKLLFIEPQGPSIIQLDDEYKKYYVIHVGM
jgi:hypothetical protein